MIVKVSNAWKKTYPAAHLGVLAMRDVENPRRHAELEQLKRALEQHLRAQYEGHSKSDLAALPTMLAYRAYYKGFKKTYHVLLQLRSVVLEGKPLPSVAALVEASFMAELKSGLLTAAHDLDLVQEPIVLDVAQGDEHYLLLNGREQALKSGDMIMTDAQGVICSVIYGLDRRTAINPKTTRVMFVVYVPEGVPTEAIQTHLEQIRDYGKLIAPQAVVDELHVYGSELLRNANRESPVLT